MQSKISAHTSCLLKMTDFIDNLLTNMSTKFNEQKEVEPINMKEDKTLKWRGLHNNQYAAVKKRKDSRKSNASTTDTPESTIVLTTGENSNSSSVVSEKIITKDGQDDSAIDDVGQIDESKTTRRTLRRKFNEELPDDSSKLRARPKKRQTSPEPSEKIEKPNDEISNADAKANRRRGRSRKSTNSRDRQNESSTIIPLDRCKSPNSKVEDATVEGNESSESQQTNFEQPKLRRSVRTHHVSNSTEVREIVDTAEEIVQPSVSSHEQPSNTCESLKKYRKKGLENLDKKQIVDELKLNLADNTSDHLQTKKSKSEINKIETIENVTKIDEDTNNITIIADNPPELISEISQKPMDVDDDETSADNTPKKRGRKPTTKSLPKIETKLDQQQIATRSSKVKKSPKLNNDVSAFSYTLPKKDRSSNEKVSTPFV